MNDFEWIKLEAVCAMHRRQIAEHGGTDGIRSKELLESALARPQNLYAYGEDVDIAAIAGSYAFGIAKNHPFLDGNKRTALVVSITFLNLNGYDVEASPTETYAMFLGLAEGSFSEDELARWFRQNLVEITP
jgi:death on curing protein